MSPKNLSFNAAVIDAMSPETRRAMKLFVKGIANAEGVLRGYHSNVPSGFSGQVDDPLAAIRENARLVFTMTWTKAILFSRSVVTNVNDGNLLIAFQSLRGYVELESWLGESEQNDEWIFCLTAARIAAHQERS